MGAAQDHQEVEDTLPSGLENKTRGWDFKTEDCGGRGTVDHLDSFIYGRKRNC
uniref:Uncharacterized protein n=1 Tax=Arundo donax TaxID=35708 RepID=A0A0A9DKV4_ARUDO